MKCLTEPNTDACNLFGNFFAQSSQIVPFILFGFVPSHILFDSVIQRSLFKGLFKTVAYPKHGTAN